MWKNAKKFFIFIGVFLGISLILSIITGLIITYMYDGTGYKGSPVIGTLINGASAVIAVLVAYKPFKKSDPYKR
ncbi:hypothetical protein AM506_07425 [Rossellomorea vietnamensis]|uniref:Uncharacterized protein n=1 Tax=Rossellomorea vietnamensis TaxID=218284 RepID=A0A0P6WH60_9BACI|nr:hypothetical protein AM506_07425 [Rossellomorea vietnamensis]